MTKKYSHNAEPTKLANRPALEPTMAPALGLARCLLGASLVAVSWFLLGWALSSASLGWILASWSLIWGPLLFPSLFWFSLKGRGQLRRLELKEDKFLEDEFYRSMLRRAGPNPEIWVREARDFSFFWMEATFFGSKSLQRLVVTSEWLTSPQGDRAKDWRRLWDEIAERSLEQRRLRTVQFCFWTAAFFPLEVLLFPLRFVFDSLGFSDLPDPGFWIQNLCWSLKGLWFSGEKMIAFSPGFSKKRARLPQVWSSLCLGVWFQLSPEKIHPLWALLSRREAFLDASAQSD